MYLCDSSGNWCCDENDVYKGCCSDVGGLLLDLGVGTSVTSVGYTPATIAAPGSSSLGLSSTESISPGLPLSELSSVEPSTVGSFSGGPFSNLAQRSPTTSNLFLTTQTAAAVISPTQKPSNKEEPKIGVGIGVPLGVTLLAAICYIVFLRSRPSPIANSPPNRQQQDSQPTSIYPTSDYYSNDGGCQQLASQIYHEAQLPAQLPTSRL